jgi:thiaminase (transcriptional activator TenA)
MTNFTSAMWREIGPTFQAILEHPFNRELAAGTLKRELFLFYMIQDAHYLGAFARALALLAAKAPTPAGQVKLAQASAEAITVERALHQDYFASFGITGELFEATPPSPTCEAYSNYLLATAHGQSFAIGCAAILPCFEIYWKVGLELLRVARQPNPFARWIETYADEEFGRTVKEVMRLTDDAHAAVHTGERHAMREHYLKATRYEWIFWDSAYRREGWPACRLAPAARAREPLVEPR